MQAIVSFYKWLLEREYAHIVRWLNSEIKIARKDMERAGDGEGNVAFETGKKIALEYIRDEMLKGRRYYK